MKRQPLVVFSRIDRPFMTKLKANNRELLMFYVSNLSALKWHSILKLTVLTSWRDNQRLDLAQQSIFNDWTLMKEKHRLQDHDIRNDCSTKLSFMNDTIIKNKVDTKMKNLGRAKRKAFQACCDLILDDYTNTCRMASLNRSRKKFLFDFGVLLVGFWSNSL